MTRAFVAVRPPDSVLDAVPAIDVPSVRPTTREQWHITLQFLGNAADIDAVTDALQRVGGARRHRALGGFGRVPECRGAPPCSGSDCARASELLAALAAAVGERSDAARPSAGRAAVPSASHPRAVQSADRSAPAAGATGRRAGRRRMDGRRGGGLREPLATGRRGVRVPRRRSRCRPARCSPDLVEAEHTDDLTVDHHRDRHTAFERGARRHVGTDGGHPRERDRDLADAWRCRRARAGPMRNAAVCRMAVGSPPKPVSTTLGGSADPYVAAQVGHGRPLGYERRRGAHQCADSVVVERARDPRRRALRSVTRRSRTNR